MKVRATIAAVVVLSGGVLLAAPAGAQDGKAYGKAIQSCLGMPYGQALNAIRDDPAHAGAFPPASGARKVVELVAAGGHPCVGS
jgi:hypothetical protein